MGNKFNKLLYNMWIYILIKVNTIINKRIEYDKQNLYVVYYSNINNDLYICEDGESALELVKVCKELNDRLNRRFTQVLYGNVDLVFRYKMCKVSDICFTFDATDEQRRDVCKYIVDTPIRIQEVK